MAFLSYNNNKLRKKTKNKKAKVIPINIKSQYRTAENRQMPTRTNDLLYTEPLVLDTPYPRRNRTYKQKKPKKTRYLLRRISVLAAAFLMVVVAIFGMIKFLTRVNATEVILDGISIGVIKDKTIKADVLLSTAISQLEQEKKMKIKVENKISTQLVHAPKNVVNDNYVITQIRGKLKYKVNASAILIDGINKAIVKDKGEAEEILKEIRDEHAEETDNITTSFVENITFSDMFVDEPDIMNRERVLEILKSHENIEKIYRVERGDSLSRIALKNSMSLEELLLANAPLSTETILREGDELKVYQKKPVLSVKIEKIEVKTEIIPRSVEYVDDNTLIKGYTKVIQEGSDGQREVVYKTTIVNGIEKKDIDSDNEIVPQVPQVIQRGTK